MSDVIGGVCPAGDGTGVAYRAWGAGPGAPPLVALAGGPGRDAAYLGDLAGIGAGHRIVVPDMRGTGATPAAADPAAYAFPRLAGDVEALREHLGAERLALLAHSAGAATAQAYVAQHPARVTHLVLVAPGSRLQGVPPEDAPAIFASRSAEPWHADAAAALAALHDAEDLDEVRSLLARVAPMAYARWDEPQRAHAAAEGAQLHPVPRAGFWQGIDDPARRALLAALRTVPTPVLVLTGALDAVSGVRAGEAVAASFPHARHETLPDAGHYPWVDAPDAFRAAVDGFLAT
jgi:pimeloyl-ACP methyl ester carboxylesterase